MTSEEIKQRTTMRDVLTMYGIGVDRKSFAHCPFHTGDREASLKVYSDNYFCYACNETGDIFTFVQKMDGCTFKEAFKKLGGGYEKPSAKNIFSQYRMKHETERKKREKQKRHENWLYKVDMLKYEENLLIKSLRTLKSLSDDWCLVQNRLTTVSGQLDILCGVSMTRAEGGGEDG